MITWAVTLHAYPVVLSACQEGLQDKEEENSVPPRQLKQQPATTPIQYNPNGKTPKMYPLVGQLPDPLKQLNQKQAAEAKLLARENRRRASALKEHVNICAKEATKSKPILTA